MLHTVYCPLPETKQKSLLLGKLGIYKDLLPTVLEAIMFIRILGFLE